MTMICCLQAFETNKRVIMPSDLSAPFPHSAVLQPLQGLIRSDPANLVKFAQTIAANAGNTASDPNRVCKVGDFKILCINPSNSLSCFAELPAPEVSEACEDRGGSDEGKICFPYKLVAVFDVKSVSVGTRKRPTRPANSYASWMWPPGGTSRTSTPTD